MKMKQLREIYQQVVHFVVKVSIGIRPAILMGMVLFSLITAVMGCHNQPIVPHAIDGFQNQSAHFIEKL